MSVSETPVQNGRSSPLGQIYDRGYQHFEGERLGRTHAIYALAKYSARRALGARKNWTAKVMPVILYVATALIIIIPLGIIAFFEDAEVLQYWDFFGFVYLILVVFVASTAPELICADRREKVLPLYFSRSLRKTDYVVAKLLATAFLLLTVSLLPAVVYWLGRQLLDDEPLQAMRDNADDLGKLVFVSVVIAIYLGSMGIAIASTTKRTAIAVAGIIVGLFLIGAMGAALAEVIEDDPWQRLLVFLSPIDVISDFSSAIWNQTDDFERQFGDPWSPLVYTAAMLGIAAVCTLFTWWRYRSYE